MLHRRHYLRVFCGKSNNLKPSKISATAELQPPPQSGFMSSSVKLYQRLIWKIRCGNCSATGFGGKFVQFQKFQLDLAAMARSHRPCRTHKRAKNSAWQSASFDHRTVVANEKKVVVSVCNLWSKAEPSQNKRKRARGLTNIWVKNTIKGSIDG